VDDSLQVFDRLCFPQVRQDSLDLRAQQKPKRYRSSCSFQLPSGSVAQKS
jgi:hypothetical protein